MRNPYGVWSCPPDPSSGVCTARADGEEGRAEETEGGQEEDCEEGGPDETDGGREEGYREGEMSGLNKQKELTRVCGATNPSLHTGGPICVPGCKGACKNLKCPTKTSLI
jgi:hypothetical protein